MIINPEDTGKVTVENINHPGLTHSVDFAMYAAMRQAMLKALPDHAPGLTQDETQKGVLPYLPQALFPAGAKAGWWAKTVQLDLEAKGIIVREAVKPLRWHRKPVCKTIP